MKTKTRYGEMHIFENDLISTALKTYGEWAQNELDFLLQFIEEGDVVIDVGSNLGYFSLGFAEKVGFEGVVIGVEGCVTDTLLIYKENIARSSYDIKAIHAVISDKQGAVMKINRSDGNIGANRFEDSDINSNWTDFTETLDDIIKTKSVSFVKMDIEGMEYKALQGAKRILEESHPTIFCEVSTFGDAKDIPDYMRSFGYRIFGLCSLAFNPKNFKDATHNMFGNAKECGFVMIHESKWSRFGHLVEKLLPIEKPDDIVHLLMKK